MDQITEAALKIISRYPLCDRCLGRLFARLGRGWSNKDRGRSLKRTIIMDLHYKILRGDENAFQTLREIGPNLGEIVKELYKNLYGIEVEEKPCYICNNLLDNFIINTTRDIINILKIYDAKKIVVGAKINDRDILRREEDIKRMYKIEYGESIKAEIRREIGKLLRDKYNYIIDFHEPEIMIIVNYPEGNIYLQNNSLLIKGRYWKKGRMISQAYWPTPTGPKYFSIEQAAWNLLKTTGGSSLIIHAAGREDVDARMLGSGRPMILEIKDPRKRYIPISELNKAANKYSRFVEFKLLGRASRKDIELYKEEASGSYKIYKVLILFKKAINKELLDYITENLRGAVINQWTPTRVLHRRKNMLRRKHVYDIKCRLLTNYISECLIKAEGGLYIKELVSGDGGRTMPSVSQLAGIDAECIELDVVFVSVPGVEIVEAEEQYKNINP